MRIISANLNGIRSAAKKGFFDWLTEKSGADILCIQETKAQIHQLDDAVFNPDGWHRYFFDAVKPGFVCRSRALRVTCALRIGGL